MEFMFKIYARSADTHTDSSGRGTELLIKLFNSARASAASVATLAPQTEGCQLSRSVCRTQGANQ